MSPSVQFALSLLRDARDDKPLAKEAAERFAPIVEAQALYRLGACPDFTIADEASGYLKRALEERTLYVPFNLVPVFPDSEVLMDLMPVLRRVQVEAASSICVSGSTTFLGRTQQVTDLDFCEYFVSEIARLAAGVAAKVPPAEPGPLARVKSNGRVFDYPFENLESGIRDCACVAHDGAPGQPVKLDFLQDTVRFGSIPATNLVLPMDAKDGEGGNAKFSFAYQEAVITPSGKPLRALTDAGAFARYLQWLSKDIRSLLTDENKQAEKPDWPIKALKRCLSLYLAIGLDEDDIADIIEELNHGTLTAVSLSMRAHEINELSVRLDSDVRDRIKKGMRAGEDATQVTESARADALNGAAKLAEYLIGEVDRLIDQGVPPH
jgi:hypothetical protein